MPRRKRAGRDGTKVLESTETVLPETSKNSIQKLSLEVAHLQEALHLQEQKTESRLQEVLHLQELKTESRMQEVLQLMEQKTESRMQEVLQLMEQKTESRLQEALCLQEQKSDGKLHKTLSLLEERTATGLQQLEQQLQDKDDYIRTLQQRLEDSEKKMTAVEEKMILWVAEQYVTSQRLHDANENLQRLKDTMVKTVTSLRNNMEIYFPRLDSIVNSLQGYALWAEGSKTSSHVTACGASPSRETEAGAQERSPRDVSPSIPSASAASICTMTGNKGETSGDLASGLLPADTTARETAETGGDVAEALTGSPRWLPHASSISVASACAETASREEAVDTQDELSTSEVPQGPASCACGITTTEYEVAEVVEDPKTLEVPLTVSLSSCISTTDTCRETATGESAADLQPLPTPGVPHVSSISATSADIMTSPEEETAVVQEETSLEGASSTSSSASFASGCSAEEGLRKLSSPEVPHISPSNSTANVCRSPATRGAAIGSTEKTPATTQFEAFADEEEEDREKQRVRLMVREVTLKIKEARDSPSLLGEQLCRVAGEGRLADVRRLLDSGAPVNYTGRDGLTPLLRATCSGVDDDVVALLLVRGADGDAVNTYGCSSMHFAASKSSSCRNVDLLIAAGASLDARNKAGVTPLHWAASRNNEAAVRALLVAGARSDLKGWSGVWRNKTPLDLATSAVLRDLLRQ